ncbi:MAG: hypothetical protein HGJ94_03865 [Desulfosarcina sp.]|nr:hypothetical protein [Desulfosarcina sp.]
MKRNLTVKHLVLAVLLAVSLTACGGGGGGGGGVSPSGISYTGLTTQAAIDENNAADLSTGAYQGGQIGDALSIGAIQDGESGSVGCWRTLKVSQVLEDALHKVDPTIRSGGTFVGAIETESGTIDGNCGGNASFSISVNDQTGVFSGSLNFNSYCEGGVTLSGAVSFSGQVDLYSDELIEFDFSFDDLTATSGSDSFTLNGDISFDYIGSTATLTITMLLKDNYTGKVYKVENYIVTLTELPSYVDVEVSGTFFDPDYGYVSISTTTSLRTYYGDAWPSDGVLVVTGSTGIAGGSTMARLTMLSSTTYQVEADTNGDGTYDWNSGILNWSDL